MLRKCALAFSLAIATVALPAAADVTIHCPAADTVVVHAIPHSVNSYFTAQSDGVEFGGFGAGWVTSFALLRANIVVADGSYALECFYGTPSFFESLQSSTSTSFQACSFANGTKSCVGSLDQCALSCPKQPEDAVVELPEEKSTDTAGR